jgi:hypothetical protein
MSNSIKPASPQDYSPKTTSVDHADTAAPAQEKNDAPEIPGKSPETQDPPAAKESTKQHATDRAAFGGLAGALRSMDLNQELERTGIQDVFLNHPQMLAGPHGAAQFSAPPYAKSLSNTVQKSNGFDEQLVPKDHPNLESMKQAAADVKNEMKGVDLLMSQGKYGAAKQHLEAMMQKNYSPGNFNGEYVMTAMKGVGLTGIETTQSLLTQLGFVDKMQQAGIQAKLPPTEQQLKDYFATFKANPDPKTTAAAKQAFTEYVGAFHVHPAVSTGDASVDIVYGKDKTKTDGIEFKTADSWKEVTTDRTVEKTGKHAGKHVNDCEGYAYLSEKLLGAAGFKVHGYVSGQQTDRAAHIQVLLEDPQGKLAVTSNEQVYDENNVRLNGTTNAEKRLELLDGGWLGAGAVGTPDFFIGATSAQSQSNMMAKSKSDRIH